MKENNTQEEIKDEICEEEAVKSEETADEAEIESDVKEEKQEDEDSKYLRLLADFQNYKKE